MFRYTVSPIRILCGLAAIGVGVVIYQTLNPRVAVEPIASADPGAAFGTLFNFRNRSIAVLYKVNSAYCINSFHMPGNGGQAPGSPVVYGVPSPGVSMANLARGDTAVLPIENTLTGPPGSEVDLVFLIKFEPAWWIDIIEKRYRFAGKENADGTWSWKTMPQGSPCG
jgi:hypothetical protein